VADPITRALESRVGVKAAVKDSLRNLVERTGYWVVRVGRVQRESSLLYTPEELERLDRDLEQLGLNERDYKFYSSPKAVRGYLANHRINSYHHLVETCRNAGVTFKDKRVMEVGVGSGYLLRILADEIGDGSLHGCDYYEELTLLARGLAPAANIFTASIEDLKSSSETYDVVICSEVLEHILDTETTIPALLGIVASGGALVLTVPNCARDFTPPDATDDGNSFIGHVNFWSKESWGFYIRRMAGPRRFVTGETSARYTDESLFAVIFNDS
jgi:2-polyprenyl-3-methyl-5-hydroxy-6-metoxy-1,4-benzoquinol methylase